MSRVDVWPMHEDIIRMVIGGFHGDEPEDTPFVTLELRATDADAAEVPAIAKCSPHLIAGIPHL